VWTDYHLYGLTLLAGISTGPWLQLSEDGAIARRVD